MSGSARPVAGLYGKLPAHGDFVARGWPDATIAALDDWLSAGMAQVRDGRDDAAFAGVMHAAPLWQGFVPAGMLGPLALRIALAPSIDRAGRLFPIAAGTAGADAAVWSGEGSALGGVLDGAIYDALAGRGDADALVATVAAAIDADAGDTPPARARWWRDARRGIETDRVDAPLFQRLVCEDPA